MSPRSCPQVRGLIRLSSWPPPPSASSRPVHRSRACDPRRSARLAHAAAHEVDGAVLPCGAPEGLAERSDEARLASKTISTPAPQSWIFLRKASHESYDSVSTTSKPRTRPRPPASQPMAVTTAVEATRPLRRNLT